MSGILAIDQGTTSTRALSLLPDGTLWLDEPRPHAQHYPKPGWVEHNPLEVLANIERLLAGHPDTTSLAMTNQGESCLAWHRHSGEPVSPIIVWQDDRTTPELARLKREGAEPLVRQLAGLPLDPYFSASKLAWLVRHDHRVAQLNRRGELCLGTTDAWFLQRLTGRCATDVSTASRTSLMDLSTLQWSEELCECFGVPIESLPPIRPSVCDFGRGLHASVVDQPASLYAHGKWQAGGRGPNAPDFGYQRAGTSKITFGTGAFVQCLAGCERPAVLDSGVLPTVAWQFHGQPARYALDGGVFSAASAVNWARSIGLFGAFEDIGTLAPEPMIAQGLVFVPALAGLGCPHWRPEARGQWLGLSLHTGKPQLVQAILEGIALRTAEVLEAMNRVQPLTTALSIDGGMSGNPGFVQCLANVTGRRIRVANSVECTALGALMMVADASGVSIRRDKVRSLADAVEPTADWSVYREPFDQACRLTRQWADWQGESTASIPGF